MVQESYPWKQDLRRRKNLLLQYNTVEKFDADENKAYTVIEKAVFYSAFIIRKLIDCDRLSTQADNWAIRVERYVALREFDRLHRFLGENTHDWNNKQITTVNAQNVCNWLIHSYIFSLLMNEDGVAEYFAVASDFDRNELLYVLFIGLCTVHCTAFGKPIATQ